MYDKTYILKLDMLVCTRMHARVSSTMHNYYANIKKFLCKGKCTSTRTFHLKMHKRSGISRCNCTQTGICLTITLTDVWIVY